MRVIELCEEITYDGVEVFPIGSRVRVVNYSPFRGLKGTICAVNMIDIDLEEPFCFYLVALEGVQLKEPIWFEYTEVELVAPPHVDAQTGESERSLRENQKGSMEWQNAAKSAWSTWQVWFKVWLW